MSEKDQDPKKKIEIINPTKPPEHVICPFMGTVMVMVQAQHGGGQPQVLPVNCQKVACVFYNAADEKCKIEAALDLYSQLSALRG